MRSTLDQNRSSTPVKAQWVKPAVTELKAGSAESGPPNDIVDGTGGGDNFS